jgi:tetratricopeptide (TPR) repeat protein
MVLRVFLKNLFLVSIFAVAASLLHAQQQEPTDLRFRLAQSYERSGEYQAAIKIYNELLKKDPTNPLITDALSHDYMELKMYDEAIAIVQRQLQTNPSDVNLHCQLASIYYLNSNEPKATGEWERAIALNPKQPSTYTQVARSISQNRLFDRAIDVYRRGRKACGDTNLFTQELAYLYSTISKYEDATREYVGLVKHDPLQTGYVQTQIGGYTNHPEGLAAATRVIEEASKSSSDDLHLMHMLAWIYMEGKHYDRAYDVYKTIDGKSNAAGHELQNFAQRALHENSFGVATAAFHEIMDRYPKFDRLADVMFGYAQAIEASDTERDTLRLFGHDHPFTGKGSDREDISVIYSNAIDAYDRVIKEFPATENAARSVLRIAILQQEKLDDLNNARRSLESLIQTYSMFPQVIIEGSLRLGDVYLLLDMTGKASAQYKTIAGRGLRTNPVQDEAAMKLAELEYFQTDFDTALAMLDGLTRNPNSDVANDAIGLQMFIQQNLQSDRPVLQIYARADLFRRQRKFLDALSLYQSIVQTYPKSGLVDEAAMSIGDVYTLLGRYTDAVASFTRVMTDYPESISLDQALMKIGQIYQEGIKDPVKAIAAYQKLLEQFPSSIYVSEARKRIRELRGDTI